MLRRQRIDESRHQLVLALGRFSNALMGNLQRFAEIANSSGIETIWTCRITCLGHLAALCHLVSLAGLAMTILMDNMCDLASTRLTTSPTMCASKSTHNSMF